MEKISSEEIAQRNLPPGTRLDFRAALLFSGIMSVLVNLQEFIERKLSGNLPDGQMMIDNDCWMYCISADERFEIDITEPGLLEALTAWGIKWERV